MKYRDPDTKELKDIYCKTYDTVPIDTIVDFEGDTIPEGWEEISSSEDYGNLVVDSLECKNIYDDSNPRIVNYQMTSDKLESNPNCECILIPIQPNTTYTVSRQTKGTRFATGYLTKAPEASLEILNRIQDNDANSITSTSPSNAVYIIIWYYHTLTDTSSASSLRSGIQVEKGDKVTEYTSHKEYDNSQYFKHLYTTDMNEITESGMFTLIADKNIPATAGWYNVIAMYFNHDKSYGVQLAVGMDFDIIFIRRKQHGTWFDWYKLSDTTTQLNNKIDNLKGMGIGRTLVGLDVAFHNNLWCLKAVYDIDGALRTQYFYADDSIF